jgi:hypothetical protein
MPSRRAVHTIGTASELDRCSRCTDAPVCRAASIRWAIAMFSLPRGREARKSAYCRPRAAGARSIAVESSAWTIIFAP